MPPPPDLPPETAAPQHSDETHIWRGHPSQWTNLGVYLLCLILAVGILAVYFSIPKSSVAADGRPLPVSSLVLAALLIPALIALIRWIFTRCHVYEVTSERIKITHGLVSRRTNELELYRVRDYALVEPFWLRVVGRGNVVLITSDRLTPEVVLRAVPQARQLKDQIRTHTEKMRQRRGVRDLEVDTQ
jgi:uncharacterized membrane protein YdbT with pleckstrin-like domain